MTLNMADAAPFLERLKRLYDEMDAAYRAAADHYGFHCDGCTDNCCLTRFYHHTHLEYLFLREGFRSLPPEERAEVRARADGVIRETAAAERDGVAARFMCPLNSGGRCRIYARRPMICRLHGIAHELHLPGRPVSLGPGCDAFMRQAAGADDYRFDRTPFYRQMAMLERELKQAAGLDAKLKMTVAEMIATFEEPGS
jgi:Fe-S-cluster containining protein